jgi:hypothetical protein
MAEGDMRIELLVVRHLIHAKLFVTIDAGSGPLATLEFGKTIVGFLYTVPPIGIKGR